MAEGEKPKEYRLIIKNRGNKVFVELHGGIISWGSTYYVKNVEEFINRLYDVVVRICEVAEMRSRRKKHG
ncbi:MAG: hypothetical protein JRD89_12425 [Deltaproteobacteria bacterium]|nr:hypothetical protein [Deltaproteobacteria bacterium]